MKIILSCLKSKEFIKHNKYLLSYPNLFEEFGNIESFSKLSKSQTELLIKHGWLVEKDSNIHSVYPILTEANSKAIAKKISTLRPKVILKTAKCLNSIKDEMGAEWLEYAHSIIIHLVLGGLWQQIWLKIIKAKKSGCIVLSNTDRLLFSELISLNNNMIMLYPITSLQNNNCILYQSLADPKMVRFLQSADDKGYVLPFAQKELQLLKMNIVKAVKVKGDFASSYKLNIPNLNSNLINKIKDQLNELAYIGYSYLISLRDFLTEINRCKEYIDCAFQEDFLQAGMYISNYVLVESLISHKVLPEFSDVPCLQGLGSRIMFTHGLVPN